jgi:hypothetical protein
MNSHLAIGYVGVELIEPQGHGLADKLSLDGTSDHTSKGRRQCSHAQFGFAEDRIRDFSDPNITGTVRDEQARQGANLHRSIQIPRGFHPGVFSVHVEAVVRRLWACVLGHRFAFGRVLGAVTSIGIGVPRAANVLTHERQVHAAGLGLLLGCEDHAGRKQ